MAEDKPRLARLTAILTQLQSKRLITARELADKHEVSIRSIYRDIRTLEQSGIPILTEEGKGYRLIDGYKLPPVMFTEEEAQALITAGHILNNNPDHSLVEAFGAALEKIKSVLRYSQQENTELLAERMQVRSYKERDKSSHYLMQLQQAITAYQLVKLKYQSLQDKESEREVEPFALIHTEENWLLIAYCRMREDFRTFRLDRIVHMYLLPTHFERHEMSLTQYFEERKKHWK